MSLEFEKPTASVTSVVTRGSCVLTTLPACDRLVTPQRPRTFTYKHVINNSNLLNRSCNYKIYILLPKLEISNNININHNTTNRLDLSPTIYEFRRNRYSAVKPRFGKSKWRRIRRKKKYAHKKKLKQALTGSNVNYIPTKRKLINNKFDNKDETEKIKLTDKYQIKIGQINIRTMSNQTRRAAFAANLKKHDIKICLVSEAKMKGKGCLKLPDEGYSIYYSGGKQARAGVAIAISTDLVGCVEEDSIKYVSDRLIVLKVRKKQGYAVFIAAYAPTDQPNNNKKRRKVLYEEHKQIKDTFWNALDDTIKSIPRKDTIYIGIDANAEIGDYKQYYSDDNMKDIYKRAVGAHAIGTESDNTDYLRKTLIGGGLCLPITFFHHILDHKITTLGLSKKEPRQIDYIMARQSEMNMVSNCRVHPGILFDSDHRLTIATISLSHTRIRTNRRLINRFDHGKLKCDEVRSQFLCEFGQIHKPDFTQDVQTAWSSLASAIMNTSNKVVGKVKRESKEWITSEVWNEMETRNTLRANRRDSEESKQKWKNQNTLTKRVIREAKNKYYLKVSTELYDAWLKGRQQRVYKLLDAVRSREVVSPEMILYDDSKTDANSKNVNNTRKIAQGFSEVSKIVIDTYSKIVCKDVHLSSEFEDRIAAGIPREWRLHMNGSCRYCTCNGCYVYMSDSPDIKVWLTSCEGGDEYRKGWWKYVKSDGTEVICKPVHDIALSKVRMINGNYLTYQIDDTEDYCMAWAYGKQDAEISKEELAIAISQTAKGKAIGPCGLEVEILQYTLETPIFDELHRIINTAWSEESYPTEWTTSWVTLLFKKGDKKDINNYRGIAVTSCIYKIIMRIILNRVNDTINNRLSDNQFAYRKGTSTTDAQFILQCVNNASLYYKKEYNVVYVDMRKCFDKVSTRGMLYALRSYGVDPKVVSVIESLYSSSSIQYKVNSQLTDPIFPCVGIKQGCPFSPLAFSVLMDMCLNSAGIGNDLGAKFQSELQYTKSVEKPEKPVKRKWRNLEPNINPLSTINLLVYADDIAIIGESVEETQQMWNKISHALISYGFDIHEGKTVSQRLLGRGKNNTNSSNAQALTPIMYNNEALEQCEFFKYLGGYVSSDCTPDKELRYRIGQSYGSLKILEKKLFNKQLPDEVKLSMFRSTIIPTLMYGAHIYSYNVDQRRKIESVICTQIRKILGLWYPNSRISNKALLKKAKIQPIKNQLEFLQLRLLGHYIRREPYNIMKNAMFSIPNPRPRLPPCRPPDALVKRFIDSLKSLDKLEEGVTNPMSKDFNNDFFMDMVHDRDIFRSACNKLKLN